MSSIVYYKFKSSLNYDTIPFDGSSISVRDLRNNIRVKCNLRSNDYDLKLQDPSGREYTKEDEQIPKYTSIIVRRVPKVNSEPPRKKIANPEDMTKKDVYLNQSGHSSIPFHQLAKSSNLANSNLSEDEKIKMMMKHSSDQYTEENYLVKPKPFGAPPLSYVCRKCNTGGHWIHNCPGIRDAAGRQVDIKTVKRPTGIPNDLLLEVEAGTPGAYLSKTGNYVVPIKDAEAYALGKKEKRPFSKEENPPYIPNNELPPEHLNCPLCKDLLKDAVLVTCCSATYCNECIMNYVFNSEEGANVCPNPKCRAKISDNESSILENAIMRQVVQEWKNGNRNIAAIPTSTNAGPPIQGKEELPKEEKVFVNNRRILVPKGSMLEQTNSPSEVVKSAVLSTESVAKELDKENTHEKIIDDNTNTEVIDNVADDIDQSENKVDEIESVNNQNEEPVKTESIVEDSALSMVAENEVDISIEKEPMVESNVSESDVKPEVNSPATSKNEEQSESSESALGSDLDKSDDESTLRRLPERNSLETTAGNKAIKLKSPTNESPMKRITPQTMRHSSSSGNLTVLQPSNIQKLRPRYNGPKDSDSNSTLLPGGGQCSKTYPFMPTGYYQQPIVHVAPSMFPASVAPTIPPPIHPFLTDAANPAYVAPQYPPPSVNCQTVPSVSAGQWSGTSGYPMATTATSGPYLPPPPGQLLSEEQFYQLKAKLLSQKSRRSRTPPRRSPSPKRKKITSPKPKKLKKRSPRKRSSFTPPSRNTSRPHSRSLSPSSVTNVRRKPKPLKPRRKSPLPPFSRSRSPPNDGHRTRSNSPYREREPIISAPLFKAGRSKKLLDERKPVNMKYRSRSRSPRNSVRDSDVRDIGHKYSRKRKYSPLRDDDNPEPYVDPMLFYRYMAQFSKAPFQFYPKQYTDLLKKMDSGTLRSMTYGGLKNYASAYDHKGSHNDYSDRDFDNRKEPSFSDNSPSDKYSRNKYRSRDKKRVNDRLQSKSNNKYNATEMHASSEDDSFVVNQVEMTSPHNSPVRKYSGDKYRSKEKRINERPQSKSSKKKDFTDDRAFSDDDSQAVRQGESTSDNSSIGMYSKSKHRSLGKRKCDEKVAKPSKKNPALMKPTSSDKDSPVLEHEKPSKDNSPPVKFSKNKHRSPNEREYKDRQRLKSHKKNNLEMRASSEDELQYEPVVEPSNDLLVEKHSRSKHRSNDKKKVIERQQSSLSNRKYDGLEIYASSDDEFSLMEKVVPTSADNTPPTEYFTKKRQSRSKIKEDLASTDEEPREESENEEDFSVRPVSMVSRVVSSMNKSETPINSASETNDEPKKKKKKHKDSKKKKKHRKHKKHRSSKVSGDID